MALAIAGCGGSGREAPKDGEADVAIVQPGAPGEPSRELSPVEARALEQTEHTAADVRFMRGMIHHHAQALVMTTMVPSRSTSADIPLLARRMEISQEAEMRQMERWLKERGEPVPTAEEHRHDHGAEGGLMPGMVSAARLERLADAKGRRFDLLFLRYMQRHHRGALTMVRRLLAQDGGAEAEVSAFTRHVEADQGIEISRMQDLRAELLSGGSVSGVRRADVKPGDRGRASRFAFAAGKPRICVIG